MRWADHLRSLAILTGAVAQIAFGAIPFAAGWAETVASRSNAAPTLLTPASYAFSIWSVIFAGCLVFALWHVVRSATPLARRLGWLAAFAFWGNAVWEIRVPLNGFDLISLGLIMAIWLSAASMALIAAGQGGRESLIAAPLCLLAGWVNAAAFVNLTLTAQAMNWPLIGADSVAAAIGILAAATLAAAVFVYRSRSLSYAAATGWGLAAIHLANRDGGEPAIALAALIAAGALGLALAAGWVQGRKDDMTPS